jgi:hypothetical protein
LLTAHVTKQENELYLFFFLKISSLARLSSDSARLCQEYHHELLRQSEKKKSMNLRRSLQEIGRTPQPQTIGDGSAQQNLTVQEFRDLLQDSLGVKYFLQFLLQAGHDTTHLQLFLDIELYRQESDAALRRNVFQRMRERFFGHERLEGAKPLIEEIEAIVAGKKSAHSPQKSTPETERRQSQKQPSSPSGSRMNVNLMNRLADWLVTAMFVSFSSRFSENRLYQRYLKDKQHSSSLRAQTTTSTTAVVITGANTNSTTSASGTPPRPQSQRSRSSSTASSSSSSAPHSSRRSSDAVLTSPTTATDNDHGEEPAPVLSASKAAIMRRRSAVQLPPAPDEESEEEGFVFGKQSIKLFTEMFNLPEEHLLSGSITNSSKVKGTVLTLLRSNAQSVRVRIGMACFERALSLSVSITSPSMHRDQNRMLQFFPFRLQVP